MTSEALLSLVIFFGAAFLTPGPNNIILLTIASRHGIRAGLPYVGGILLGFGSMAMIVFYGIGQTFGNNKALLNIIQWLALIAMLWLSWKIASAPPTLPSEDINSKNLGYEIPGFRFALVFQFINPKAWLILLSVSTIWSIPSNANPEIYSLTVTGITVLIAAPIACVWLAFGTLIRHWLATKIRVQAFNISMGILLAATSIYSFNT